MLAALWGYLGDKLKMSTSELNRQNVSETLQARGIGEGVIKEMVDLLDECEFAKYAPSAAQNGMDKVYDEGVNVINNLEDAFKQQKNDGNEK